MLHNTLSLNIKISNNKYSAIVSDQLARYDKGQSGSHFYDECITFVVHQPVYHLH